MKNIQDVISREHKKFITCFFLILFCSAFSILLVYQGFLSTYHGHGLTDMVIQFFKPNTFKLQTKETAWEYLKSVPSLKENATFQLDLEHCKIPKVPANSIAYQKYLGEHGQWKFDKCDQVQDFTSLQKSILKLTDNSLNIEDCCIHEIFRDFVDLNDGFRRGAECMKFDIKTRSRDVSHNEFLEIVCTSSSFDANGKRNKKYNHHINIPDSGRLMKKADFWRRKSSISGSRSEKPEPPSIFLLMIDSTSRTEMYRNLPKTMKFLTNEMGFVDFKGHHPMGEATLVNVVPMMVGLQANEFWKSFKMHPKTYWDNVPFLWKFFDQLQYITAYVEDLVGAATFNYGGQHGFIFQPTDIYIRPFMMSFFERFQYKPHQDLRICFGHRPITEFIMGYFYDILNRFPDIPKFLVNWPCWPQHDIGNSLHSQDLPYLEFFQKVNTAENNNKLLDNTIFIVASDHSMFHGSYFTSTHEGFLERRNMPLLIRPSNRMVRENPEILKNLVWNSQGITSHFDLYKTLLNVAKTADEYKQIFTSDETSKSTHGSDLFFQKISESRTCQEALIPETICACNLPPPKMFNPDSNVDIVNVILPEVDPHSILRLNSSQYELPFF